ncbi:MAG: DNA adenine methylase [Bacteroidetes bacterium]|nr:DNA adenine methylase [Bacteroidota bacterium]
MGNKHKLLPWIYEHLNKLDFQTVLDGFSGSGVVSYLFKSMGKKVTSNDFLHFSHTISKATCENSFVKLQKEDVEQILLNNPPERNFISKTFQDIFFTKKDLEFLDMAYANISNLNNPYKKALGISCLLRACIKKQPRGVFTVSGNLSNYNDGRRDLRLSLKEHFIEQVDVFNELIFDNRQTSQSINSDIFELNLSFKPDLVYLDPPYVPRSDDNCYVKRYHFLEGLSKYWEGETIMKDTKVKKIQKKYTPFSYRSKAIEAFDQMFKKFQDSIIVLSYSNNGFPDLTQLEILLKKYKSEISILKKPHKYHFGNHSSVKRSNVEEYLIIGR